jgi:hypothetical protein
MLVDNITYENQFGQISNLAKDGSPNDVAIAAPHPASQEWSGVAANSVVIYALDTPVVTPVSASAASVGSTGRVSLGSLAAVTDPAGKAVTQIQVYDSGSHLSFLLNGVAETGITAAHPLTAASLAAVTVVAATGLSSDTLEIRASNGTYWGDWEALTVKAPSTAAPVGRLTLADWVTAPAAPRLESLGAGVAARDIAGGRHDAPADLAPVGVHGITHFAA